MGLLGLIPKLSSGRAHQVRPWPSQRREGGSSLPGARRSSSARLKELIHPSIHPSLTRVRDPTRPEQGPSRPRRSHLPPLFLLRSLVSSVAVVASSLEVPPSRSSSQRLRAHLGVSRACASPELPFSLHPAPPSSLPHPPFSHPSSRQAADSLSDPQSTLLGSCSLGRTRGSSGPRSARAATSSSPSWASARSARSFERWIKTRTPTSVSGTLCHLP